jgi:hypothetical protein
MKTPCSKSRGRRRLFDPTKPRKASPTAKLASLPEDQVAQIVAWLFNGKTYAEICSLVKSHFGVTCSMNAVKTVWDKYAAVEQEMRDERIVRRARIILQSPEQS